MSIYIKDMGMPTGKNGALIFAIRSDGMVENVMGCYIGKAVPVPAHGRLIDADAFIGTIRPLCDEDKFAACTFETVKRLMVEHINNAPTIIPAEEGET